MATTQDHLNLGAVSTVLMNSREQVIHDGETLPYDLGGSANTKQVPDVVIKALYGSNKKVFLMCESSNATENSVPNRSATRVLSRATDGLYVISGPSST